jgi:hypothetical protein
MAKLFRTVLPMVMAGVVGAIGTHTPDWLAQLLGPK